MSGWVCVCAGVCVCYFSSLYALHIRKEVGGWVVPGVRGWIGTTRSAALLVVLRKTTDD